MSTSCIIKFGRNAIKLQDIAASIGNYDLQEGGLASFGNIDDLANNLRNSLPFATYEPDFWLLDGNYKFAPEDAHGAWTTEVMSGEDTDFDTVPELKIVWNGIESLNGLLNIENGLTIYFSEATGDWCDNITIVYRAWSNSVIRSDTYNPDGPVFSTNQPVSGITFIEIFLNSTNKPHRRGRVKAIEFDTMTMLDGIVRAEIVEQIDPSATSLPANTLEAELFSDDGDFSIIEPAGVFALFSDKEPLDVYENIHGDVIYMGRFYLDRWESKSTNHATLYAFDAIGMLGETFFRGRNTLDFTRTMESEMNGIRSWTGIYTDLDSSLASEEVHGWLGYGNWRDYLQKHCIAVGAYASCARSNAIKVRPMQLASDFTDFDYVIEINQKSANSPVELRPLVTGIHVVSHSWAEDDTLEVVIFDGTLGVGTYRIPFDTPVYDYDTPTGTATVIGTSITNGYGQIEVTSAGTVRWTGYGWRETRQSHELNNESLPTGTQRNILEVDGVGVIEPTNGDEIAQRLYDYFQQRIVQRTRLFAHKITVGDRVLIRTQNNRQIAGIVEKCVIDLTGGMISEIDIVGVLVEE